MVGTALTRPARGAAARQVALLAALWAAAALPATACTWQASAELGPLASRWRETDSDGQTLLQEHGTLAQAATTVSGQGCPLGPWSATLAHSRGNRQYDGQSSNGAALQTRSRLQHTGLTLQALPWGDEVWRLGLRLRWQRVDRDIQSTATALGYPERFDTVQAALVAGLSGPWRSGPLRWDLQLALGGGPGGHVKLQLPGLDAATLRLGSSRLAQLDLGLQGPVARGWQWRLGLQAQAEHAGAGPARALTRNGQVVGAASQPATWQSSLGLGLALQHRFDD